MQAQPDRNFIDDLVSYFGQKAEVQAAYFAFLYSNVSETHDLFLGVEHRGELDGIKTMTLFIKRVYLQDAPMFFASSEEDPDTFALVKEQGLQFFSRQALPQDLAVSQHLLKRLFDEARYADALPGVVREHGVYALVDKGQLAQKKLALQAFEREQETFTPLFTDPNMLFLGSGQATLPPELALAKLVWNKHLVGAAPRPVVLNPDTAFEAKFEL